MLTRDEHWAGPRYGEGQAGLSCGGPHFRKMLHEITFYNFFNGASQLATLNTKLR